MSDSGESIRGVPGERTVKAFHPREAAAEVVRLRDEIAARVRQETAIAELGQAALTGIDPYILLGQACALVEMALGVSHCRALEATAGGRMIVRVSLGSNQTFQHCDRDDEENESLGLCVLLDGGPVVFANLEEETRFKSIHLRTDHGVHSGVAVTVLTHSGPFGVLLAYSDRERRFEEYEIAFLRSTANIVGAAFARDRTAEALRKSESRLKQVIASTLDAVVTLDQGGKVIEWNPQAEVTFGLAAQEVLGAALPEAIVPERIRRIHERFLARSRKGNLRLPLNRRIESVAHRANGEEIAIEITIERIGHGSDQTFTAFIRDISARKRAESELEQRERRFRAIVERSWSGFALLDSSVQIIHTGSSTERLLGYREHELNGRHLFDLLHPRERDRARETFGELIRRGGNTQGELRFHHKNGSWVWLEGFAQNLLHDPSVGAIVLNYRDITQSKETEKRLEYQANYDALTGLPNRMLFTDRVVNALARARRTGRGLAIMHLDLDQFKFVNDTLGHTVGDELLSQVALRLQSCLRSSDSVSRLGGDEFTILINEVENAEAVAGFAQSILKSLGRPFRVHGRELFATASVGISIFPADGDDAETLLKCADGAMYRAKELGRNQVQLFTASMNERYGRRLALEQSLHQAVERQEFELWYQPIVDRLRRSVVSFEALIRWKHPLKGIVEPAEFISLAEESGLIVPIGTWVVRTACRQLREWRDAGLDGIRVGVNLSAHQFVHTDLVELVTGALRENGLAPDALELEITETVAMQSLDTTMQVLRELRAMGVTVAVDDFGTGQSSLIYLQRFPITTIKIDKVFLRDVTTDDSAAAIVSYVIGLAHTMGLHVVAEGVETEEQYRLLRDYRCDFLQGYLLGRPMRAGDVLRFAAM